MFCNPRFGSVQRFEAFLPNEFQGCGDSTCIQRSKPAMLKQCTGNKTHADCSALCRLPSYTRPATSKYKDTDVWRQATPMKSTQFASLAFLHICLRTKWGCRGTNGPCQICPRSRTQLHAAPRLKAGSTARRGHTPGCCREPAPLAATRTVRHRCHCAPRWAAAAAFCCCAGHYGICCR